MNNEETKMDLIDGKYLEHEICAFSGNQKTMWLVVYDGKYNYMLFDATAKTVARQQKRKRFPSNHIPFVDNKGVPHGFKKEVEFYSNFDNAVDNLVKVVTNNDFLTRSKVAR